MNRDAYIKHFHPYHRGGQQLLALLLHNAVAHVAIPIGWTSDGDFSVIDKMTHIRHDLLRATDRTTLNDLAHQLSRTEAYLLEGKPIDDFVPTDEDVRRLFSLAYHFLDERDPQGKVDRQVFAAALKVLEVGDIIPERSPLRSTQAGESKDGISR